MHLQNCSQCQRPALLVTVTARLYERRKQLDYRYRLCADCRKMLECILEGPAMAVTQGMFDHQWAQGAVQHP